MSNDLITCNCCGDAEEYEAGHFHCDECNKNYCWSCCDDEKECPVCTLKVIPDSYLLKYILSEYKINYEYACYHYREERRKFKKKGLKW